MLLTDTAAPSTPAPLRQRPRPADAPTRSAADRVRLEPARPGDWWAICDMVARNFPLISEETMGYWLCHQLPYFQVARLDGQVVGFLHAQPRRDTGTLWVNLLAVDHRYRQRGIGHRLVEHFATVARDWDCQAVGLQCLTSNVAAMHLYASHGYARLNESISEWGLRVVAHRKALRLHEAPPVPPRPPVRLDSRARRLCYRALYLLWFRHRLPQPV